MRFAVIVALALGLALPGCAKTGAPTTPEPSVGLAVAALYRPYAGDPSKADSTPDWDRPVFSAETKQLIDRWKLGFRDDEVLDLQDFGWFCECQDWDPKAYRFSIEPHGEPSADRIEINVHLTIDSEGDRRSRLELVREGGAWRVDDLHSQSFPGGLKSALGKAIAEARADRP